MLKRGREREGVEAQGATEGIMRHNGTVFYASSIIRAAVAAAAAAYSSFEACSRYSVSTTPPSLLIVSNAAS